jgi:hypothetical protein
VPVVLIPVASWSSVLSKGNREIIFEENEQRLKVIIPTGVNWPVFILHTVALLVWLGMLIAVLVYLVRGLSSSFVLTLILLFWILIWLWFGRFLWTRWQYNAANREVLFVEPEQFIIRRPVSILGLTWVYDIKHIEGLYYSEQHSCPAFDYAYQHVYFGRTLDEDQARSLVDELNRRYFPNESVEEIVF